MDDRNDPGSLPSVSGPAPPDAGETQPLPPGASPEGPPQGALAPGGRLGDFEIVEEIGRGGMGVVYKAYERTLRRTVALKVLHSEIAGDPSLAKRFRREAILAANLSHPNIVPVFQIEEGEQPRYFTMEFVQGRSLKDKIHVQGGLAPDEAVRIALAACDALEHAHQHTIIHRDIKPANILLQDPAGRVRITDFGIAQDVTGRLAEVTTTEGTTSGTPAFMSPEQNLGRDLDARTDIFSLGMTLYYMLTGRVAYQARNRAELAVAFQSQAPDPPSRFAPGIPPRLDQVVMKMIAVDPAKRYATCEAVARDLKALDSAAAPQPPRAAPIARMGERGRQGALLAAIAVAAVALVVVLVVWLILHLATG
jgi:serine/threonine-protein kinase